MLCWTSDKYPVADREKLHAIHLVEAKLAKTDLWWKYCTQLNAVVCTRHNRDANAGAGKLRVIDVEGADAKLQDLAERLMNRQVRNDKNRIQECEVKAVNK